MLSVTPQLILFCHISFYVELHCEKFVSFTHLALLFKAMYIYESQPTKFLVPCKKPLEKSELLLKKSQSDLIK